MVIIERRNFQFTVEYSFVFFLFFIILLIVTILTSSAMSENNIFRADKINDIPTDENWAHGIVNPVPFVYEEEMGKKRITKCICIFRIVVAIC